MIWDTVSSWSCFCQLYRASSSLAAKNIINLISILTIWWYTYVESSLGCWKKGLLWPVCSLDKTLLAFALLHSVLQDQLAYFSTYLLTSYFCIPVPYDEKDMFLFLFFLLVLVIEGLVGFHGMNQLQILQHQWLGHRLGLLWSWMICLGNELRSFCHFWDGTQVLHFGLFCWLWGLLHFF